jgi:hypothetical protein
VEGPGDILYLQAWSRALQKLGKQGLDRRWTICPSGGIDKIQPFVSLFSGAKLNIAALTDYSKEDKRKLESMKQNRILESDRLLTFASLLGLEEGDIEDVFALSLYASIVNKAFNVPASHEVTAKKLEAADKTTGRLLKKTEALFRVLPQETAEFDHFTPAAWLFENPSVLEEKSKDVTATLDHAEIVIKALNKLLANLVEAGH